MPGGNIGTHIKGEKPMSPSEIIGKGVMAAFIIAALSLIVAPGSQAATIMNAFGSNFTSVISAAKNYPK